MKPFRAPRLVIKETQEAEMEHEGRDMAGQKEKPHQDGVDCNGKQWTIEARKERTESVDGVNVSHVATQVPSLSLSDFGAFFDYLESERRNFPKDITIASNGTIAVPKVKTHRSATDEYWESVLQSEKERLGFTMVPVDAMMVGASSDEDDVPIVNTLSRKHSNLGILATVAAETSSPGQLKKRNVKQTRWTYETVCEPTGVASKYWDADAPSERATKRLAKQRINALNVNDLEGKGKLPTNYK